MRRHYLGASGALNGCNRAKSPVTGRLQIPLVYFAPAAGIFYPIKTVYPTRSYVVPRRCAPQLLLWCFAISVKPSRRVYALRQSACYTCLPLEGKVGAKRSDEVAWRVKRALIDSISAAKKEDIHVFRRRNKPYEMQMRPSRHLISRLRRQLLLKEKPWLDCIA